MTNTCNLTNAVGRALSEWLRPDADGKKFARAMRELEHEYQDALREQGRKKKKK